MLVELESQAHTQQISSLKAIAIETAIEPLLDEPPKPVYSG